ncbi:hypothetical protein L3Q82_002313 [Scortum barcoo]|uniref:Uncharacterized protein n=1 Tax=Scortum barcoo TaxID=214431 RepID=A0ACB8VXH2_9TELE|nr:hypothetical protein L3Q82_002313 [Scortum barcoo]
MHICGLLLEPALLATPDSAPSAASCTPPADPPHPVCLAAPEKFSGESGKSGIYGVTSDGTSGGLGYGRVGSRSGHLSEHKGIHTDSITPVRPLVPSSRGFVGFADSGCNAPAIKDAFSNGLNENIKDQLAPHETPEEFEDTNHKGCPEASGSFTDPATHLRQVWKRRCLSAGRNPCSWVAPNWLRRSDSATRWRGPASTAGNLGIGSLTLNGRDLSEPNRFDPEPNPGDYPDISRVPPCYHDLHEVFNKAKATSLPPHRNWDCAIDLFPGAPIPKARLYSISSPEWKALDEYIEASLRSGIIRPLSSPAGAGFFFVGKKDGSLQPCIDYSSLKNITVKNRHTLPLISSAFEQLQQAKIFTTLDLRNAYHLVRIREGGEWKTGFNMPTGHYEYLVMLFDLTNAPAVFQGFINEILQNQVKIDLEKVSAVTNQVQQFLGFANFYRKFIRNFSAMAAPLHALTSPKVPFQWGSRTEEAFQ